MMIKILVESFFWLTCNEQKQDDPVGPVSKLAELKRQGVRVEQD